MADDNNMNGGTEEGQSDGAMLPEDLRELLDRAERDESEGPVYDPDAEDEAGLDDSADDADGEDDADGADGAENDTAADGEKEDR